MRILNVTQSYAPFFEFGGPPVKIRALSAELAGRGHPVTVLTADWNLEGRFPGGVPPAGMARSPFGWRQDANGVQAIYLPTWLRYRALSWNPAVKRFARARLQNFEVVHIFGLYDLLGPAIAERCRAFNIPYVVEPIGMFLPIVRSFWKKRAYQSLFGTKMLDHARFLIATSEQEAAELASGGIPHDKIFLRRNGVEFPRNLPTRGTFRAKQGIPSDARVVLFLGRLSAKKSPGLLLEAFAALGADMLQSKDARLVFAGPDDEGLKATLSQTADRLGVRPRVLFTGPLFEAAKWEAHRDADVFVLPSQNENFGNTAAEAVAAGTPVVLTEGCGIGPLLADAGITVAHNSNAISEALRSLLTDPALHAKLAAKCPEVAGRLGWAEPAEAMESLYRTLASPSPRI
ncbi:MAG TPA: glycosyltransferase [Candidatus Sulfotelmatobacter sp.]|nr:glycosyltransferase [Candidatus Sulfotelmatobacter sp.]